MNDLQRKLKHLKHIAMREHEREHMRSVLSEYTSLRPVKGKGERARTVVGPFAFLRQPVAAFLVTAFVVFGASGSISFAAERAVPGDALYPVKVGVNEPVRSALALSGEAEAELQAEFAERRLEEAEQLAAHGSLTTETREALEGRFDVHVERYVKERDGALAAAPEDEGVLEIDTRFKTALEAHGDVLAALSQEEQIEERVRNEIEPIIVRLQAHTDPIAIALAEGETQEARGAAAAKSAPEDSEGVAGTSVAAEATDPDGTALQKISAEKRTQVARQLLHNTRTYFERRAHGVSEKARERTTRDLAEAEALIDESKEAFAAGDYSGSLEKARAAMRAATHIRAYTNIDVIFQTRALRNVPPSSEEPERLEQESASRAKDDTSLEQEGEELEDVPAENDTGEEKSNATNDESPTDTDAVIEVPQKIEIDSSGRVKVQF